MAQITPNASIVNSSNGEIADSFRIIQGGIQVGNNFFHSFSELDVFTGSSAYFNNFLDIENIFTRVNDNNIFNID
ncbi:hypothetical protein [Nostoc sp. FACHB-888]|uniref:two-partner secretion domain-containing protein n=1 Tax=Nostoc sp. FACHB-888 TaxID=2692842 RepID=UPI0018EF866F|nr:hypothetical protein [Nostoc sp. FACHB-888]